jgi:outer membrane protein TolC
VNINVNIVAHGVQNSLKPVNNIKNIIEGNKDLLQIKVRQLETLLGRYPENKLKVDWKPTSIEMITEISNPFDLILRRPDIQSNESKVRALFYLNEQALLAKYPSLVLSASISLSSVNDLLFGAGASLFGPIFNGGALDGRIDEATAQQKQALATYGLSILNAFKEVETSLNSQTIISNQENFIQLSSNESKKAYEISVKQYEIGAVDLFDVLQIQLQWLLKELDLVTIKEQIYHERVQLHLALGGNITH